MIFFRERTRRYSGVLAVIAAIIAVAIHVTWAPAATVIGPTPTTTHASITLTSSTTNLADGASVNFHVDTNGSTATGAVTLTKVEAKICKTGFTTYTTTTFGYSGSAGTRCVFEAGITSGGLTGAQYRLGPIPFSSVTTSGDQFLLVGTGSVAWTNSNGFPGTLTCDSANPCDLVVDVGLLNDTITDTFFIQPLTFSGSGTTTTTTSTTTTPSSTTTTTTPSGTTTTSSSTTSTSTSTTTSTTTTSTTTTSTTTTTTTTPATTTTTVTTPATTSSTTTTRPSTTTTTTAPQNADGSVNPSNVGPGGTITVQSTGWKPSSAVAVTLHSDPVTLGSLDAHSDGTVSGTFTIPAGTAVGAHNVLLTGSDLQNVSRTVTLAITVQSSSTTATLASAGTGSSGTGNLAFTGSATRNIVSVALLFLAVGLFALGQASRRRTHEA